MMPGLSSREQIELLQTVEKGIADVAHRQEALAG